MHGRPTALAFGGIGTVIALVAGLSGCSLLHQDGSVPHAPTSSARADGGSTGTEDSGATQVGATTPTTPPLAPKDAVVAETDVVSPSGDTAIHVRIVADGEDGYRVRLSGYRTTVSQPMSVEFRRGTAKPGDGWDADAVGMQRWDAGAQPPADSSLSSPSIDPTFLHSVVLVPLAPDNAQDPPPWVGHVLAAAPLTWSMRQQFPRLRVQAGKAVPGAYGIVSDGTDGSPSTYLVAHGDEERTVAERFGISEAALEWLNPTALTTEHWLYEGTTINLSPRAR